MFHPELLSFFALMKRSPDVPGPAPDVRPGWKSFSGSTRGLVLGVDRKFPGLFEVDAVNMVVRAHEGEVLVKWMSYVPPNVSVVLEDDDGEA